MPAITYPSSPTDGQEYTDDNGVVWVWKAVAPSGKWGKKPSTGEVTLNGAQTISNKKFVNFREGVIDLGDSGPAVTLNIANHTVQQVTLTGNCLFTMPTVVIGTAFLIDVIGNGTAYTATFTGVDWNGTTQTLRTGSGDRNTFAFRAKPDGSGWLGLLSGSDGGGSSAWADITGKPAAVTALTGTNTGDQTLASLGAAPLASPTFTGTVTIPSGAAISGYLTTTTAASTYQPIGSYAPSSGIAPSAITGTAATLSGTQTITGDKIFDGGVTVNGDQYNYGNQNYIGNESHYGEEVHEGDITYNGPLNFTDTCSFGYVGGAAAAHRAALGASSQWERKTSDFLAVVGGRYICSAPVMGSITLTPPTDPPVGSFFEYIVENGPVNGISSSPLPVITRYIGSGFWTNSTSSSGSTIPNLNASNLTTGSVPAAALGNAAPARRLITGVGPHTALVGERLTLYNTSTVARVDDPTGTTVGQQYTLIIQLGTTNFNGSGTVFSASRFEIVRFYNGSSWSTVPAVVSGDITATTIGATTPGTGAFTTVTASGAVTVSGGGNISGSSGAVTIAASGTNQNIILTPSGTGSVTSTRPITTTSFFSSGNGVGSIFTRQITDGIFTAGLRFTSNGNAEINNGNSGGACNLAVNGNLTASGKVTEGVYTVATTPTHSLGDQIRINNATGATIGSVVAGTGSQHVVARSNGTQWICTSIIIP